MLKMVIVKFMLLIMVRAEFWDLGGVFWVIRVENCGELLIIVKFYRYSRVVNVYFGSWKSRGEAR